MSVTLMKATIAHARGIARVYVDAWRTTYAGLLPARALTGMSYDRQTIEWAHLIRQKGLHSPIFVAIDGRGTVAGITSFGRARIDDLPAAADFAGGNGATGEIFTLYVHPDSQDRGIGRVLMETAFAGLREKGLSRAYVWVLESNPARYFYERMGGRYVADRTEDLWGIGVGQCAYAWPDVAAAQARLGLVRPSRFG
ncbi:MAG: GNAT family N-acetyltransferase [Rhodospirillales bacterium]|nr:GNAT family N-acetyltransferase [Rhodospirillales bacterium]